MTRPASSDSDYWAQAKLADLLAEHVASPVVPNTDNDFKLRTLRAAELQALESHLLRRLIEAQAGALLSAATAAADSLKDNPLG